MNKEHFTHHPTVPMDVRGRSVREIIHAMTETRFQGRKLGESVEAWVRILQEYEVTIMIGIGLVYARRPGHEVMVDQIKDADELTQMVEQSTKTGVVYVGGGVPKNLIQQTEVIASLMGGDVGGHDYAIQYTTDAPHWGGLSGRTFDEAVSWGKVAGGARKVQVFVDATIALPIVAHALRERMEGVVRGGPMFDWGGDGVKVWYE